jgi:hypothetical protein
MLSTFFWMTRATKGLLERCHDYEKQTSKGALCTEKYQTKRDASSRYTEALYDPIDFALKAAKIHEGKKSFSFTREIEMVLVCTLADSYLKASQARLIFSSAFINCMILHFTPR